MKPAGQWRTPLASVWVTLAAAVVVCALGAVLHLQQRRAMEHAELLLRDLGRADADLAVGFLHLTLGGDASSPWNRDEGMVLLRQALRDYERSAALLPPSTAAGPAVGDAIAQLRTLLGQAEAGAATPAQALALRLAMHRMHSGAEALDDAVREQQQRLDAELDRTFAGVLGGALLLLAATGLVVARVERRRTASEHQLREGEERFRALVEQTGSGIAVVQDGAIAYVNPAGAGIVGSDAAALVGRGATELVVDGERARLAADLAAIAGGDGRPRASALYTAQRADGSTTPIELHASRGVVDGAPVVFALLQDIGAKRAAEQALLNAAERVRAIEDSVPEQLVVLDAEGRVVTVNAAFRAFQQAAPAAAAVHEGVLFLQADGHLHGETPEQTAQLADAVRSVLGGARAIVTLETGGAAPDQRCHWVSVTPLRTAGGGAVVAWHDITERRRAEDAVARHRQELELRVAERTAALERALAAQRESDAFWRTVADNQPTLVACWTHDLRLRFANRAWFEWFGFEHDATVGRKLTEIVGRKLHERFDPDIVRVLGGESLRSSERLPGSGGRVGHFWIYRMPDIHDGSLRGFFSFATDVSELVAAEQRLDEVNRALVVARDRAEAASEAKSAFLANMSHEIRTPMNAIIGLTHLLQREIVVPQQRDRLARVADAAQHLMELLNDILDLSKIEAGKLVLEAVDFDARALLARSAALVGERAAEKGLAFSIDAGDLPERLRGDPTRLSQALLNLLSNAVKFTERGSVRLEAALLDAEAERCAVRFDVVDTGIGIAADKQGSLFSAFEQADSSMTRRFGGTGLGLAITRRLVQLMGGEIGVDSWPGAGSRFWFTAVLGCAGAAAPAPRIAAPAPTTQPAPLAGAAEVLLAHRHRGCHVLLAEDNPVNQDVARELLHAVGLRVDIAADGREAVAMAQRHDYALLLMDVQMPVMDGLAASRALRALPGWRQVPILAMTANAFAGDRQASLAAGMNDHIAKPVDPEALFTTLLRWLPDCGSGVDAVPADDAAAAPAGLPMLGGIPGFDGSAGLRLTGLRPDTYLAVLRRYVAVYGDGMPALPLLADAGDGAELQRLSHSLRGASAVIGAMRVQALCTALEAQCSAGADRAALRSAALALQLALQALVAALRERLELQAVP